MAHILEKKYEKAIPEEKLDRLYQYVDQFNGPYLRTAFEDPSKIDKYIDLLTQTFVEPQDCVFNEFEKQIILVKLLSENVERSLEDIIGSDWVTMDIGLLISLERIYREFVLGNKTTDQAFSDLIRALQASKTYRTKPECKRIFRAMQNLAYGLENQTEEFKTLYIPYMQGAHLIHDAVKKGYECFLEQVKTERVTWNFTREFLSDKHSGVNKDLETELKPRTLLDYYYNHLVNLYLGRLPPVEKLEIRNKMKKQYLTSTYKLHELPRVVREYKEKFEDIDDQNVADALCYQLINTLSKAFEPIEKTHHSEQNSVGNWGLDSMQTLHILESVVNRAMNEFVHRDKPPAEIYDLIITGLESVLKEFHYPELISANDKEFNDLTRALREAEGTEKRKELIALLKKVYYRYKAAEISTQLEKKERKQLVEILKQKESGGCCLLDLLLQNTIPGTKLEEEASVKEYTIHCLRYAFEKAYTGAPPAVREKVIRLMLSHFETTETTNNTETLAKDVYTWPEYFEKFSNTKITGILSYSDTGDIITAMNKLDPDTATIMFKLIGYVVYCNSNPLEGLITMGNESLDNYPRYYLITSVLKGWASVDPKSEIIKDWQRVVQSLQEALKIADHSIDYELLGKCCVALQNTDLKEEILNHINEERPLIIQSNLPPTLAKIYTKLRGSKPNLQIAKDMLKITDPKAGTAEVIREVLRGTPDQANNLLKALGLGSIRSQDKIPYTVCYEMLTKLVSQGSPVAQQICRELDVQHPDAFYQVKNMPESVMTSTLLCQRAIETILDDVVHTYNPKLQQDLLTFLDKHSESVPDFTELSDDDILKIVKSVKPIELETVKSKVFSVLMEGKASGEVLKFAESDYFDKVSSYYLGSEEIHDSHRLDFNWSGRRYWKNNLYTQGRNGFLIRYLYANTQEAKNQRKDLGVPYIQPKLFQQTVELVMKNANPDSFTPKAKFYSCSLPASPMNTQTLAEWYKFSKTKGICKCGSNEQPPDAVMKVIWAKFVEDWCKQPDSTEPWLNNGGETLIRYITKRLTIFTQGWQIIRYQDVLQHPLTVAIAVFKKIAERLGIHNREELNKLPEQERQNHPLYQLLEEMELAFIATDSVCNAEAEDLCMTWKNLIIDTYYEVNRHELSSSASETTPEDKFIGKICYASRRKAMATMTSKDPIAVNPVNGVEAGRQLTVVYSEGLNVHPESVVSDFVAKSGESCGTAEFVTPVAPNRVRAQNASKSLTLGSIIDNASEITKKAGQKDKEAMKNIINQTKDKKRDYEELVRVFDDKSLLLKTNELLLSEDQQKKNETLPNDKKTYYFGKPEEFGKSWALRSRLDKLIENLDTFFQNIDNINTDKTKELLSQITNYDPNNLRKFVTDDVMKKFEIDETMRINYNRYKKLESEINNEKLGLQNPIKAINYVKAIETDLKTVNSLPDDTDFQNPDHQLEELIKKYASNEKPIQAKETLIKAIQDKLSEENKELPTHEANKNKIESKIQKLKEETASLNDKLSDTTKTKIINAENEIDHEMYQLTIKIVHVLYKKIKQKQNMTLKELDFFLRLCVDIYEDNFDGVTVVSECKLDKFGNTFTTDILPLYLVDSGYVG